MVENAANHTYAPCSCLSRYLRYLVKRATGPADLKPGPRVPAATIAYRIGRYVQWATPKSKQLV